MSDCGDEWNARTTFSVNSVISVAGLTAVGNGSRGIVDDDSRDGLANGNIVDCGYAVADIGGAGTSQPMEATTAVGTDPLMEAAVDTAPTPLIAPSATWKAPAAVAAPTAAEAWAALLREWGANPLA